MEWLYPHAGDYYVSIIGYGTSDATLFMVDIKGDSNSFFYTLQPTDLTSGTIANDFWVSVQGAGDLTGTCDVSLMAVMDETVGQAQLVTSYETYVSGSILDLTTNHSVSVDRTEFYGTPGSQIFWESHDVSESADATNPLYSYDNQSILTSTLITMDTTNVFKLVRDTSATYGGIDGTVFVKVKSYTDPITDIYCYIDSTNTPDTTGSYLGMFSKSELSSSNITTKAFVIDSTMMDVINENKFLGTTLKLVTNQNIIDSTIQYHDSFVVFNRTVDSTVYTDHSVDVVDNTTPIIWREITTINKVKINSGKVYVFDYYTPGSWWQFDGLNKYTVDDWNYLENIAQNFGRFFHSPLYYDVQSPYVGHLTIIAKANGTIDIYEDCPDSSTIITYTNNDTTTLSGFELCNNLGDNLQLYLPSISPDALQMDGTYWRLSSFIKNDSTLTFNSYYDSGGVYVEWYDQSRMHPFSTDATFHVMFYGKKA